MTLTDPPRLDDHGDPAHTTIRPGADWVATGEWSDIAYATLGYSHGLALRIPHPEGYDHPNLLIVLAAATLGTTRLIDNVDVVRQDGKD